VNDGLLPRLLRWGDWFLAFSAVGCVLVLVGSVAAVWPYSLLEHFRVQHVALGLVITIACGIRRRGPWVDIAFIATLCHLGWLLPDLAAARRPIPTGRPLRALVFNVHLPSMGFEAARRLIVDVNADVVALVEPDTRWFEALAPTLATYPSRVEFPLDTGFGIGLYARGPLTAQVRYLGTKPTIVGTLQHEGRRINVIATHPIPPIMDALVAEQDELLAAIAALVRSLPAPTIVLGDLNTTPWSHAFLDFVDRSGLCDTRAGFGMQATYPASSVLLRVPLDHVS
jgi:endonuclease/exonuclease/phosphatase (EEP) superfamily protein YafD